MSILITGVTGFAGVHLAEALLRQGEGPLVGVCRSARWPEGWGHLAAQVRLYHCDLCQGADLREILGREHPTAIYHLAGYASPGRSFAEGEEAWAGNLTATRRLYDALACHKSQARVLYVGSGLVYGEEVDPATPLTESTPLCPTSPYAASKAAADLASYQYSRHPGLDIVRARPFNHIGPGQSPQYAVPSFARQIVAIERGEQAPVLETGNLGSRRDLSDVRDVVAAYVLLMRKGVRGEAYNIASGQTHAIQEVLDRLIALAGIKVEVRQRADLVRAVDPSTARVDTGRLRALTGWQPRYSLDQTLADILEFWRGRAAARAGTPAKDNPSGTDR